MTRAALLIDFGSTYTKLRAIDLERNLLLGSSQGPSTIDIDITIGMELALKGLTSKLGYLPRFEYRLASSSAAGGLRMVTIGLVKELTVEAAKRAALGAGAKLIGVFSSRLNSFDVLKIVGLDPDIILLAGGTDGGDSQVVIHNSKVLGLSTLNCPIVFAGNQVALDEVILNLESKHLVTTENVMPEFGVLNIDPARSSIRRIFIERIVNAKGIDKAKTMFDSVLMPTPAAVLDGARLIADGTGEFAGLGELIVIDPGGATTDVHSVALGSPSVQGVVHRGLPETRLKRTVEGDLGMRHNAATILEAIGIEQLSKESGLSEEQVLNIVNIFSSDVERLPSNPNEVLVDQALAKAALKIAMKRHCGLTEVVYTANGPVTALDGKDLSSISTVIATGGVIAHSEDAESLIQSCLYSPDEPNSLRPKNPKVIIDRDYIVYAVGLLSQAEPQSAYKLAINSFSS